MRKKYTLCSWLNTTFNRKQRVVLLMISCVLAMFTGRANGATGTSIAAVANSAPVLTAASYSYTVADNVALGTTVGSVRASDPDGNAITYSITAGNTNKAFAINSSTGAITVAKKLGYHTQSSYSISVRATDTGGLYDVATVTITVTLGSSLPSFSTIAWGTVASQPYVVYEAQGEVVNGKLYTFGGFDSGKMSQYGYWTPTNRAYVYNPSTNTWTSIASMPPMNGTNYGGVTHAGFTTDGTDIYFAGGYTSNATGTGQIFGTKEVWKYIVAENRYTRLPNLPKALAAGQLEYLNGKLHHIAGFPGNPNSTVELSDHYVLDLDNLASGWKILAPIPNRRNHPGSTVYNGKIYFMGGQYGNDDNSITQKFLHVYNPATNTWTRLADMPVPSGTTGRAHISSSVTVIGDRILVIGGETSHTVRTNMVSAYSPVNNTWQNLTPFPKGISGGVAAILAGNIYYTGGPGSKTTYKGVPGSSTSQKVASFTLINADNEQAIQTLTSGSTLNLATLPTKNLNIRANTSPTTVGSVVFNLSGAQSKTVTESRAPYALYGDNNYGDYYAWTPAVGSYTLKGTPYTASGGTGTAGTSLTVNFTVTNQATTSTQLSQAEAGDAPEVKTHQIKVYPNPNSGHGVYMTMENFDSHEAVTVTLYDLLGRVIRITDVVTDELGNGRAEIVADTPIARGAYFVKASARSGKVQAKLIID